MFAEEPVAGDEPIAFVVEIVSAAGVDLPFLRDTQLVVACEVGVRRADGVLQSESHQNGTADPAGEVLDVEVGEPSQQLLPVDSEPFCCGEQGRGGPGCDVEVIGEVVQEGDVGGRGGDAVVEGAGGEREGGGLRAAFFFEPLRTVGR